MRTTTLLPTAATVYILAWLAGLVAARSRPAGGSAAEVKAYFVDHAGAAIAQSLLVHGLAGVALAGVALSLSRAVKGAASPWVAALGVAAAILSLVQVAVLLSVAASSASLSRDTIQARVGWIDSVDTMKLFTLAAFTVVASLAITSAGLARSWLVSFAGVLALLLIGGGASFLMPNRLLTTALYLSLPLLLIWVGVVGTTVTRQVASAETGLAEVHVMRLNGDYCCCGAPTSGPSWSSLCS